MRIAVIGTGVMGETLLAGLVRAGTDPRTLVGADPAHEDVVGTRALARRRHVDEPDAGGRAQQLHGPRGRDRAVELGVDR